jgi:hypothetical protein
MPSQNLTFDKYKKLCADVAKLGAWEPIVAGGAVRDLLNGRQIKDIDLFLCSHPFGVSEPTEFSRLERYFRCAADFLEDKNALPYDKKTFEVMEFRSGLHYVPVQCIVTQMTPTQVIDNFDFGLCKAWCTQAKVHCHKDYYHDQANQRLTFVSPEKGKYHNGQPYWHPHDIMRSSEHLSRLKLKYPTFRPQRCGPLTGVGI